MQTIGIPVPINQKNMIFIPQHIRQYLNLSNSGRVFLNYPTDKKHIIEVTAAPAAEAGEEHEQLQEKPKRLNSGRIVIKQPWLDKNALLPGDCVYVFLAPSAVLVSALPVFT